MTEAFSLDRDAAPATLDRESSHRKVLVLGDDTRSFLATVRSLGRRDIEVHVAPGDMRSPALRSRYIARIHRLPPYVGDGREWVRAVSALLAAERFVLVIPCQDTSLLPFHAHRDAFEHFTRLAIPDARGIEVLFDKEKTKALAANLGVNIAHTLDPEATVDPEEVFRRLGPPVVVKPKNSYRLSELYRRAVVQILDTPAEVARAVAPLESGSYYFEEFFQGRGVGLSVLADRGDIVLAFQHHRVHEGARGGAAPYRISAALDPELLDACTKITRHLAFTGVAMFEFRRNFATGRWILLEINARPWGSLPLPVSLGIDFPFSWYRLLVDGERPEWRDYRVGIYGRNLGLDFQFLLSEISGAHGAKGRIAAVGRWLASFSHLVKGKERDDTIVADDPWPGLLEIQQLLVSYAQRAAERLRFATAMEAALTRHRVDRALRTSFERTGQVKLVFVCYGNICRSPFAEAVAAKRFAAYRDRVTILSAGTNPVSGRESPPEAIAAARRAGIDLARHRSRYLSDDAIDDATVVFVFDAHNRSAVLSRFAARPCPVALLGHLGSERASEIQDPFGMSAADFDRTYRQIDDALEALDRSLSGLTQKAGLPAVYPAAVPDTLDRSMGIEFSLRRIDLFPDLAKVWRDLESRADVSFFLTWDWIGCWLEQTRLPAFVLAGRKGGRIVALGILNQASYRRHALINSEALLLNQAGDPELDNITIEYNGFLLERDFVEQGTRACLTFLQSSDAAEKMGRRWDEIHFDGVPQDFEAMVKNTGLTPWLRSRKPSWRVDLEAVRQSGRPYLDHLSANTRYQIRRAMRLYERQGPLTARRAADIGEAMRFYAEMQELHQRYWTGRGQRGSYAFPFYGRFHEALLARCLPAGKVELVRVAAGDSVIGYVYNFIHRGWVGAYHTGLSYDVDPKLKPGLVAHYLCIVRHLAEKASSYDLLAGDSQYKRSLGTPGTEMLELVLQRPIPKLRLESALRQVKRKFTSGAKDAGLASPRPPGSWNAAGD